MVEAEIESSSTNFVKFQGLSFHFREKPLHAAIRHLVLLVANAATTTLTALKREDGLLFLNAHYC